jgi:hypothetical protein
LYGSPDISAVFARKFACDRKPIGFFAHASLIFTFTKLLDAAYPQARLSGAVEKFHAECTV